MAADLFADLRSSSGDNGVPGAHHWDRGFVVDAGGGAGGD
jgi:hypothetical protein